MKEDNSTSNFQPLLHSTLFLRQNFSMFSRKPLIIITGVDAREKITSVNFISGNSSYRFLFESAWRLTQCIFSMLNNQTINKYSLIYHQGSTAQTRHCTSKFIQQRQVLIENHKISTYSNAYYENIITLIWLGDINLIVCIMNDQLIIYCHTAKLKRVTHYGNILLCLKRLLIFCHFS